MRFPFVLLLTFAALARAAEPSIVAVLPLDTKGADLDPALRETLEEALRSVAGEALSGGGYTILTGDTTLAILDDNGVDAAKACDASCHLTTARELKAKLFLSGSLAKVEGAYVAFVRLFEAKSGRQVASAELDGLTVRELRQKFRAVSARFFAPVLAGADPLASAVGAAQALLSVESKPKGALVSVDAKPVGTAPIVTRVVPGTHVVEAVLDGYLTESRRLDAKAGDEPMLTFELTRAPPPARPWYWRQDAVLAYAGIALAGGGVLDWSLARDGKDGLVEVVPVVLYLGGAALAVYGFAR